MLLLFCSVPRKQKGKCNTKPFVSFKIRTDWQTKDSELYSLFRWMRSGCIHGGGGTPRWHDHSVQTQQLHREHRQHEGAHSCHRGCQRTGWLFPPRVRKILRKQKVFNTAVNPRFSAACVQVHGPASQHVSSSTMTVSPPKPPMLSRRPVVEDYHDDYRKEALRKGKCLSIGIQVLTGRR